MERILTGKKMAKAICIGEVLQNTEIRKNFFLLQARLPHCFADPLPGQFVMARIYRRPEPFLSRPISVYSFNRKNKCCYLELLYRVVGRGTAVLAGLQKGEFLEISGPLGKGYRIDSTRKNIVFLAGGIGVAPLSLLAWHFCETACSDQWDATFYLGAQTAEAILGLERLKNYCRRVVVCTDDGSLGEKSLVTAVFQKDLPEYPPGDTAVYACGPRPMLRSLAAMLGNNYFCQTSLEERMACGVGACMGCAVAIKDGEGKLSYQRVCADGPVFDLRDVLWE